MGAKTVLAVCIILPRYVRIIIIIIIVSVVRFVLTGSFCRPRVSQSSVPRAGSVYKTNKIVGNVEGAAIREQPLNADD